VGKWVRKYFTKWAINVFRWHISSLQNELLGASKRFREQLERVKDQFVSKIEVLSRESEAVRAELSASNATANKLEMENRILRSSPDCDSEAGISKRRRNSIQNDIQRNERVTPEVVLARRKQERAETTAQQHIGFGGNLRGTNDSGRSTPPRTTQTPNPNSQPETHLRQSTPSLSSTKKKLTPSSGLRKSDILPNGNGFATLQASAKRAAERLKRSSSNGSLTSTDHYARPHRQPPLTPGSTLQQLPTAPTNTEGKRQNENNDEEDDIIPVDDETMEKIATDALNFFGGKEEKKKTPEERKRRIMSLDNFMNRKAISEI
jgi:hypothetical protein